LHCHLEWRALGGGSPVVDRRLHLRGHAPIVHFSVQRRRSRPSSGHSLDRATEPTEAVEVRAAQKTISRSATASARDRARRTVRKEETASRERAQRQEKRRVREGLLYCRSKRAGTRVGRSLSSMSLSSMEPCTNVYRISKLSFFSGHSGRFPASTPGGQLLQRAALEARTRRRP